MFAFVIVVIPRTAGQGSVHANLRLSREYFQAIRVMTQDTRPNAQQIAKAVRCSMGEVWLSMATSPSETKGERATPGGHGHLFDVGHLAVG